MTKTKQKGGKNAFPQSWCHLNSNFAAKEQKIFPIQSLLDLTWMENAFRLRRVEKRQTKKKRHFCSARVSLFNWVPQFNPI